MIEPMPSAAVAPVERIAVAVPDWYACEGAAQRLARLAEGAALAVDTATPAQLDTIVRSAPGAYGLLLHPSAEDMLVAAAARGEPPSTALAAWEERTAALLAQCRRLSPRIAVLDPHAVLDDDALAETLGRHLGLALPPDGEGPARSRDAAAGDPVARFLCRLAVLESAPTLAAADALRRYTVPLWSAPDRANLDEALAARTATAREVAPTAHDQAEIDALTDELAATRARLMEAEAQLALLQEQTVLLQEAVGADIFDTATLQHQTIYADDGLTHSAFYPPERRPSDGRPFRWLGREAEAVLPTDISRTRAIRVDLELAVVLNRASVDGLSVTLSGARPVRTQTASLADGSTLLRTEFAVPDSPDPLSLARIGLHAGHMVDLSSRGDPRSVAVGIHKIEIWHMEEPAAGTVLAEVDAAALPAPAFAGQAETPDGAGHARWLDPAHLPAELSVTLDRARPVEVLVHIAQVRNQASLEALALEIDGQPGEPIATEPLGQAGAVKRLRIPAAPDHAGPTRLTLSLTPPPEDAAPTLAIQSIQFRSL